MTATTAETLTLDSIAEKLGLTLTYVSRRSVKVSREGYPDHRAARAATDELTLAQQLAGHLHPAAHPQEWAVVKAVLNPGVTVKHWLVVAAKLGSE